MTLSVGTRLDSYEITGQLGAGGMGEVYRATDTKLGREVAIKTLSTALAEDADRLARFEREAKLLASLSHAHIASVYNLDESDGIAYIAMEFVEGGTLEEKLKAGALPLEDALRLGLQIALALEAAHEKGVVHRDLKPANIMVTPDGVVKVLDFGLAKAFSGDPNAASPAHSPALSLAMTQQGLILGTAGYMSPEQASGQATDQRTDVWAFGVVLYEMLVGRPLFSGESVPHILADVLRAEPDWQQLPKNLNPRLRLILERCLEKKVRDRYHSIADVRIEVEKVLSDPQGTREVGAKAAAPATSELTRVAASIAFVAAGAAIAGIVGWSLQPEPTPATIDRWVHLTDGLQFRNFGRPVLALSPDGRRFVYNTTEGLFVRELDELEARLIPGTEENLTNPFFSPDGQSVAYYGGGGNALRNGQLRRVALNGGAAIAITNANNPLGASWTADGMIFYSEGEGIYRVPAVGGTPELVIPAEDGEFLYGPELLPDGDSVLFTARSASAASWNEAQVVIHSLASNERKVLVPGGSDAHYIPTGHLLYAFGDGIYGVAFDLATLSATGGAVSLEQGLLRGVGAPAAHYGVAADGTLVYASASRSTFQTLEGSVPFWVDRDGNEEALGLEGCNCTSPSVSPDGTRLAFHQGNADVSQTRIWVWSLTQGTKTQLTFQTGLQVGPVWSPDSTRVAYTMAGGGIFVRSADGTGMPEQPFSSTNAVVWAWPADDELIITEDGDIAVISPTGDAEKRPLLTTEFEEYRPAVSPDGRWIAYESNRTGQVEVFVRPYPDMSAAGPWRVSSAGGQEPYWSPDGRTLFFFGPTHIMAVAIGDGPSFTWGTAEPTLDHAPYNTPGVPPQTYAVSPDGQRFLMWRTAASTAAAVPGGDMEIIVVRNWVEELKRRVPTD